MPRLVIETHPSVGAIDRATWNELVADGSPFLEWDFLDVLESTGCVGDGTGWYPAIITVRAEGDEQLLGALPFYLKEHSRGEFVYDWGWADAAQRAGLSYYPKAVVAVPFTPVTGDRLLIRSGTPHRDDVANALVTGAIEVAKAAQCSSVHFNFITSAEADALEGRGLPLRYQTQYHWYNGRAGGSTPYGSYDEFLQQFRSKRRANLRRESRKLAELGVTTRVVTGDALDDATMRKTFRFYADTVHKFYWGHQYLNEDFFVEIGRRLRRRVHLVIASIDGDDYAGTFNLFKGDRLYGRYWGALRDLPYTHFEVCMYRPIAWCIENGISVFEPGHGGEHKFERGFEPTKTYSAHWIAHPRLDTAIRSFLADEGPAVDRFITGMKRESPYREP